MKFSTKAEYGLRAIIMLAEYYPQTVNLSLIAKKEDISFKYLERIMALLKKDRLIEGKKGPQGGYTLLSPPYKIQVGRVIESLEGPLSPMPCNSKKCKFKKCSSKKVWLKLGQEMRKVLYNIKLNDLL